ncbi:ankyrin repeat domain-containing protein [Candidatus Babeliales bacterium]|nr:ankyrin repeat domain-containing protein [Candidatus Babeliales bacterium]
MGKGHEWQPIFYAVTAMHSPIFKKLLQNKKNLHARDFYMRTPLHWAASHGRIENIKQLIYYGADVNAKDCCGATPLSKACTDMIHILTSTEDVEMEKACAIFGRMVEALVRGGADINAKDKRGYTPLQKAMSDTMGWPEAIEKFIELGVDLEATNKNGETALHSAAASTYPEIVEALIGAGINIDVQSDYGETPLHRALRNPFKYYLRYITIKTLVNFAARMDVPDCIGETAESLGVMNLLRNPPKPKIDQGWYF